MNSIALSPNVLFSLSIFLKKANLKQLFFGYDWKQSITDVKTL
jgi:hypothetical protein